MADKELSIRLKATGGDQVKKEFSDVGKQGKGAFNEITNSSKPATQSLEAINASAKALNGVFRQAGVLIGSYLGLAGLTRGFSAALAAGKEYENLNVSIKALTGSAKEAETVFASIEKFSASTPYSLEKITNTYIKLRSAGLTPATEAMRAYANIATATNKELSTIVTSVTKAAGGNLKKLKAFGVAAKQEGDQIAVTFDGITTKIDNNKKAIEQYIITLGNTRFAGALESQMNTLDGAFVRIQKTLELFARRIGSGGLTTVLAEVASEFHTVLSSAEGAADMIGETLGKAIRATADAFAFLYRNGELITTVLGGFVVARTAATAFSVLQGAAVALTASIGAMGTAAGAATIAITGLGRVVSILGGPAGVVALTGYGLYQFTRSLQNSAKEADIASQMLQKYRTDLGGTDAANKASKSGFDAMTRSLSALNSEMDSQSLEQWSERLSVAEQDLQILRRSFDELRKTGVTKALLDSTPVLRDISEEFLSGAISAKTFREEIVKIGESDEMVRMFSAGLQKQLLAIETIEDAIKNAYDNIQAQQDRPTTIGANITQGDIITPPLDAAVVQRLEDYIQNLELEIETTQRLTAARKISNQALAEMTDIVAEEQELRKLGLDLLASEESEQGEYVKQIRSLIQEKNRLVAIDARAHLVNQRHEDSVRAISSAYTQLGSATERATAKAEEWRKTTLEGLDQTRSSYAELANQVEYIYSQMLVAAREKDKNSMESWKMAMQEGFASVVNQGRSMTRQLEALTTNSFRSMEDALVQFVKTGALTFERFVDSVVTDLARLAVTRTITAPIAGALGSVFGASVAHEGGVLGEDRFPVRAISASTFNNAPKFHSGGVVGRETPILAQRGEVIFTPGQIRALGSVIGSNNSPPKTTIHIHNSAQNVQATAETKETTNGGLDVNIFIERVEHLINRNISKGTGLAPTLEQKYALNPVFGSYR